MLYGRLMFGVYVCVCCMVPQNGSMMTKSSRAPAVPGPGAYMPITSPIRAVTADSVGWPGLPPSPLLTPKLDTSPPRAAYLHTEEGEPPPVLVLKEHTRWAVTSTSG